MLDHPVYSPDPNPIINLCGLIVAKFNEEGRQYTAISELKNEYVCISTVWQKLII